MSLSTIPTEILLHLASLVLANDCRCLSQTSSHFRNVLLPLYIAQITVEFPRPETTSKFFAAIENNPDLVTMIRKVHINCISTGFGDSDLYPPRRDRLESLFMNAHEVTIVLNLLDTRNAFQFHSRAQLFSRIIDSLTHNSHLYSLKVSISTNELSMSSWTALSCFARALPSMHTLRRLSFSISGVNQSPTEDLEKLFHSGIMAHVETLHSLEWDAVRLFPIVSGSSDSPFILKFIEQARALKELKFVLGGFGWSLMGCWLLIRALSGIDGPRLRILTIEGSEESLEEACTSCGGTLSLHNLDTLNLISCKMKGDFGYLNDIPRLRSLSLTPGSFGIIELESLGTAIASHKSLRSLFMGGLNETRQNMMEFMHTVSASASLRTFSLRGFSLTRAADQGDGSEILSRKISPDLEQSGVRVVEWNGAVLKKGSYDMLNKLLQPPQVPKVQPQQTSQRNFSLFQSFW
ncbi:hypothetical protein BJ742DRAFT_789521 [Cladochytrium replicatum]|nr:hypothetical protein BJ742DRAFT_789521 [Cladochytrium replicatum]